MARMSPEAHRQYADANGQQPERLSEYFDFDRFPDKAKMKVTRNELLAIITMLERGKQQQTFAHRLWRFLKGRVNSGPVRATEPTAGEQARGEA